MSDTIEIVESYRGGTPMLIGIAGESDSGKTYSALQLAYGLANRDATKIGVIDAENKRCALYSDMFKPQRFKRGDLYPPFAPQRYIDGIRKFIATGVEVLFIDSVSHAWEGEGGCSDIAWAPKRNGQPRSTADWITAKAQWKRLMGAALFCPMHVILGVRAREAMDYTNQHAPVSIGVQPIIEKNAMFEMTASLMMHDQGRRQTVLKCPEELRHILGRGDDYITALDGMALRQWVDGGNADPLDRARNILRFAAVDGTESMKAAFVKLSTADKKALVDTEFYKSVKAQAAAVDAGEPIDETPIETGNEGSKE